MQITGQRCSLNNIWFAINRSRFCLYIEIANDNDEVFVYIAARICPNDTYVTRWARNLDSKPINHNRRLRKRHRAFGRKDWSIWVFRTSRARRPVLRHGQTHPLANLTCHVARIYFRAHVRPCFCVIRQGVSFQITHSKHSFTRVLTRFLLLRFHILSRQISHPFIAVDSHFHSFHILLPFSFAFFLRFARCWCIIRSYHKRREAANWESISLKTVQHKQWFVNTFSFCRVWYDVHLIFSTSHLKHSQTFYRSPFRLSVFVQTNRTWICFLLFESYERLLVSPLIHSPATRPFTATSLISGFAPALWLRFFERILEIALSSRLVDAIFIFVRFVRWRDCVHTQMPPQSGRWIVRRSCVVARPMLFFIASDCLFGRVPIRSVEHRPTIVHMPHTNNRHSQSVSHPGWSVCKWQFHLLPRSLVYSPIIRFRQ